MDLFAAESAAWTIKARAQDIASDAHILALATKHDDFAAVGDLERRAATISKLCISIEKAVAQFKAAAATKGETV